MEFLVTDATGPQNEPAVSGDTIVWRDGRDGTCYDDSEGAWDIYGMNAATMVEEAFVVEANIQNHPELGGDYMAWVDRRSAPDDDLGNSDYNEVYLKNIVTGVETRITNDDVEQCRPNTDGKTVVWHEWDGDVGYYKILAHNIATGGRSVVATATNVGRPQVEGDLILWKGTSSRLFLTRISSKDTTRVADESATGPSFDGNTVVWANNIPAVKQLRRYDVGTKLASTVATSVDSYYATDHDGEWVVYQMDQDRTDDYDVYAFNMLTGVETTVSAAPDCQGNPSVDGGLAAWNDNRDPETGYPDIYAKYLDWTEGVENPLSGVNRFATAALASRQAYPYGAENVVVATAFNWPDALSGGVLAAVLDCPILLTTGPGLPVETALEIERLGVKNAYVIGSTAAVSSTAFEQIDSRASGKTVRLGGANRFETSELVAKKVTSLQGGDYAGKAFFATASNFPDALAGTPLAGRTGSPILLADGDGLRAGTIATMKAIGVEKGYVLGSADAVPNAVKNKIESVTATSAVRLGGANRYATAATIANYGVTEFGMKWFAPALATGANFPDALAAGPMQARIGSPLLLTSGTMLSGEAAAPLKANKADIERVSFVGSTKVISAGVRTAVKALLK